MPRFATLIAALVLALPGSALAQGAGDDQYQDPFAEDNATAQTQDGGSGEDGGLSDSPSVGGGSDSSGSGSGSGSSGSGSAGQTGETTTPAPTATQPATGAEATDQLPNTGSDPRILMLCGLAFVLIGVGLRLRTIDPHAY